MKLSTYILVTTLAALVSCSYMPPAFSSKDPIPEKKQGEFDLILDYDIGKDNFEIRKIRTCSYLGRKRNPIGSYVNQWESSFKDEGTTGKGILLKSIDDNKLYYYLNNCQTIMTQHVIENSRDAFLAHYKGSTYYFSRIRSEELLSKYKIRINSFSENEVTTDAQK